MISPRVKYDRQFTLLLILFVGFAWLALALWGASPYSRYLGHEAIQDLGGGISVEYAGLALAFVAAWLLMTIAMMLPTALPLVLLFQRLVSIRPNGPWLTLLVIVGYLTVWSIFGALAHLGDLALHMIVAHSHWIADRAWILSGATVAVAGVYQFTPLKYLCLEKCRSPFSFVAEHWHGQRPFFDAFGLGAHHGIFCVGCCWSLMLLMFAFGISNVAWMMGLSIVMGIEKNFPWGRRLSKPIGIMLLSMGMGLFLVNAGLITACAHDGGAC